ncbi:hypothetical protein MRX96_006985 [Rhipicephalus microplus]
MGDTRDGTSWHQPPPHWIASHVTSEHTYAETNQFPLSLRAKACALRHVKRMHVTRRGKVLVNRLLSLPDTGMGRSVLEYASLIFVAPFAGLLPIPSHCRDSRMPISIRVSGIRSKGHTPRPALLQETCAMIEERYSGHRHLYTDGSVKWDGSAATASIISVLRDEKCRLLLPATSTTAELAALNLAADQLAELLPSSAVIFCDSRAALLTFVKGENGPSIAQRLTRKFTVIMRSGCAVSFQWVPLHVGVRGSKAANALAKNAHDPSTPTTNFVHSFDVARQIIARHVRALHPDARTAAGNPVARLASTGIGRSSRAFLLRLRTGCSRTAHTGSSDRVAVTILRACSVWQTDRPTYSVIVPGIRGYSSPSIQHLRATRTATLGVSEATLIREGYAGLPLGSLLTGHATATADARAYDFCSVHGWFLSGSVAYRLAHQFHHHVPCCIASRTAPSTTGD